MKIKKMVEGRYPHKPTRFDPENITLECISYPEEVVLRLDDSQNDDVWMQITLTREELKRMLLSTNQ